MARNKIRGKAGVRFKEGFTTSKRNLQYRALATQLIVHGRLEINQTTAHRLKAIADNMITLGKTNTLHSRRQAEAYLLNVFVDKEQKVTALQKLFNEIAPKYQQRVGGYTRVLKIGNRRGDNAPMSLIEFV